MPARRWMSRMLLGTVAMIGAAAAALWLFAAAVLGSDAVRARLEQQISSRLGQPVAIGRVSGSVLPRLAVERHDFWAFPWNRICPGIPSSGATGIGSSRRFAHSVRTSSTSRE
jgi:hypothetical protein